MLSPIPRKSQNPRTRFDKAHKFKISVNILLTQWHWFCMLLLVNYCAERGSNSFLGCSTFADLSHYQGFLSGDCFSSLFEVSILLRLQYSEKYKGTFRKGIRLIENRLFIYHCACSLPVRVVPVGQVGYTLEFRFSV